MGARDGRVDWMKSVGFKALGAGVFGTVMTHPKKPGVVYKVGEDNDWPSYAKWAAEHGYAGTFAPKVLGYNAPRGMGKVWTAKIERLGRTVASWKDEFIYPCGDDITDDVRSLRDDIKTFTDACWKIGDPSEAYETALQRMERRWPGAIAFLEAVVDAGFVGDWHDGNIMLADDGKRIILNDPQGPGHWGSKRWRFPTYDDRRQMALDFNPKPRMVEVNPAQTAALKALGLMPQQSTSQRVNARIEKLVEQYKPKHDCAGCGKLIGQSHLFCNVCLDKCGWSATATRYRSLRTCSGCFENCGDCRAPR